MEPAPGQADTIEFDSFAGLLNIAAADPRERWSYHVSDMAEHWDYERFLLPFANDSMPMYYRGEIGFLTEMGVVVTAYDNEKKLESRDGALFSVTIYSEEQSQWMTNHQFYDWQSLGYADGVEYFSRGNDYSVCWIHQGQVVETYHFDDEPPESRIASVKQILIKAVNLLTADPDQPPTPNADQTLPPVVDLSKTGLGFATQAELKRKIGTTDWQRTTGHKRLSTVWDYENFIFPRNIDPDGVIQGGVTPTYAYFTFYDHTKTREMYMKVYRKGHRLGVGAGMTLFEYQLKRTQEWITRGDTNYPIIESNGIVYVFGNDGITFVINEQTVMIKCNTVVRDETHADRVAAIEAMNIGAIDLTR